MNHRSHFYYAFCIECGKEFRAVRFPFTYIFITLHLGIHENKSKTDKGSIENGLYGKKNLVIDLQTMEEDK